MIEFRVQDMSCGGCVRAIGAAVAKVAPTATVTADVPGRRVSVSGSDDVAGIAAAIAAAGFDAVPISARQSEAGGAQTGVRRAGCCCGGGARAI